MPSKKQQTNWLIYIIGFAAIIIILVVVATKGGVQIPKITPTPQPIDEQVRLLQQQSASDDINSIEQDLKNTNLDQIDTESAEVDQSLQNL